MDLHLLPVFPLGSIDSSVITTVWIGVFVVAFFNLRFGWVLSGLVVPGYLVPLLLVKPWAFAVVILEGAITYAIVWVYSEPLSKLRLWSSLFGRDRFFAFVVTSVAVRLVMDGGVLPFIAEWMQQSFQFTFDYRSNLHSFGLIIIALIANNFWKTGFLRGLLPLFTTIAVTFIIVRFGLLEFTNFNISNLAYMYEDMAVSLLASPKAYIIVITTAFIASRMNLRYGWDYNGILIPSLLALQWYQPSKIVTSFLEAFLILLIAQLILKLPIFAKTTIEGARKLVLFFNISFIYKILLGYGLAHWLPAIKVSDLYGFGYLLPTLMAIKMHDKEIAARLTRSTIQTSLVGFAVASLIGFSLHYFSDHWAPFTQSSSALTAIKIQKLQTPLIELLENEHIRSMQSRTEAQISQPLPLELNNFFTALSQLEAVAPENSVQLDNIAAQFAQIDYQLTLVNERYFLISEITPKRGWGYYVVDSRKNHGITIEIPAALDEKAALATGIRLFSLLSAQALAITGAKRDANPDKSADVLRNRDSIFHIFHQQFDNSGVLQVRQRQSERRALFNPKTDDDQQPAELASQLWVKGQLPTALRLNELKTGIGSFQVFWGNTPRANIQREQMAKHFAELRVSDQASRRLFLRTQNLQNLDSWRIPRESQQRIDGYLQAWLGENKDRIAVRGSNAYQRPKLEELLFFDEEVITPLLQVIDNEYQQNQLTVKGREQIQVIATTAALMGYELFHYRHTGERDYLILREKASKVGFRYWGLFVFRLGDANEYIIQVPRPLFETHSFAAGAHLFERLNAKALLIAGTHPDANLDGSADVVQKENLGSLFSLVNQSILREHAHSPGLVIHCRAFGAKFNQPLPDHDALFALSDGIVDTHDFSPLVRQFLTTFEKDGLQVKIVDSSLETAGYEANQIPQSWYTDMNPAKQFGVLWFSPLARRGYRSQSANRLQNTMFAALEISSSQNDLFQVITTAAGQAQQQLPNELMAAINRFVQEQDIVTLARIKSIWSMYKLQRIIDRDSQQAFMLIYDAKQILTAIVNLEPRSDSIIRLAQPKTSHSEKQIQQFLQKRAAWLVPNGPVINGPGLNGPVIKGPGLNDALLNGTIQ